MEPCIEAVKSHVANFVASLATPRQQQWDVRLDFVAHRAGGSTSSGTRVWHRSAKSEDLIASLYGAQSGALFLSSIDEFKAAVSQISASGNESNLIALDCCLDFPWRPASSCHRVVILLSDEPVEGGCAVDLQLQAVPRLLAKLQDLRVMLFIVAPDSQGFMQLSGAQRSEYTVVDSGDGLASANLGEVLSFIGKSVSKSQGQGGQAPPADRALFGQTNWTRSAGGWYAL
jgi:hypothetical protein